MAGRSATGIWRIKIAAPLTTAAVTAAAGGREAAVTLNRVDFAEHETVIFVTGSKAGADHVVRALRGTARGAKMSLSAVRPAEIHRFP